MTRHPVKWLLFFLAFIYPLFAMADRPLTDEQKKTIVYKMYREYKKDFPGVKDIAPTEAMKLLKTGSVLFVDTRTDAEMKISMLPQAISEEAYLKNKGQYRDKKIVLYCTISYRSGKLAQSLKRQGMDVYNLKGGLLAWVLEGGKVYNQTDETKRIHVYGEKWNYPPSGYEAVMFTFWERFF